MSAIKQLVNEIVDYAGLFPPAKLPIEEVAQNYENYLGCDISWMLARLVMPASRLHELAQQQSLMSSAGHWRISALVPSVNDADAFAVAMKCVDDFNAMHEDNGRAIVDAIEIKAPTVELIQATAAKIPDSLNAFLEIPHADDPDQLIAAIESAGDHIFAKIRTGGVTANLIPPAEQVARFIVRCGQRNVGFKATAGLHHPIAASYRLTYDPSPEFGNMFGYLNVFVAAMFAFNGADESTITQILQVTDAQQFEFTADQLRWADLSVSADQIAQVRNSQAVSFGSCSFTEPTEELAQLGLLGDTQIALKNT